MGCRVGVVAVPYNQLKYNMHRVGVVAEIIEPVKWEGGAKNHPVNFVYRGNGVARVMLVDGDFELDMGQEGGMTMPVDLCSDSVGGKEDGGGGAGMLNREGRSRMGLGVVAVLARSR